MDKVFVQSFVLVSVEWFLNQRKTFEFESITMVAWIL